MDKIFWRNLGRNPAKEQFAIPSASQIAQVQNMQRLRVFSELHKLGGREIELFFGDLKIHLFFCSFKVPSIQQFQIVPWTLFFLTKGGEGGGMGAAQITSRNTFA